MREPKLIPLRRNLAVSPSQAMKIRPKLICYIIGTDFTLKGALLSYGQNEGKIVPKFNSVSSYAPP